MGRVERQCSAVLAHRPRKVAALAQRIPARVMVVRRQALLLALPLLPLLRLLPLVVRHGRWRGVLDGGAGTTAAATQRRRAGPLQRHARAAAVLQAHGA